ncbi:MAG: N-acetyltransferase family protein [Ectobacillus sp.]
MKIRKATVEDVPGILEIYNDAVLHTTATFDLREQTLEERTQWFYKYNDLYPLVVAEIDGRVAGYCSLSPFREKEAYKRTVEISVYVHRDERGKGIARRLIEHILLLAKQVNHHVIIAGITKGNEASIRLHEEFGFIHVGTFCEVGYKFDEWQDVLFYQLILKS